MNPTQSAYLDLMRGAAAQAVLVGHSLLAFGAPGPLMRALPHTLGVLVFFLLSGFLITLTTLRKADRDPGYGLGAYLTERGFRIFTPYVPALVFVAAVDGFSAASPQYRWQNDFDVATWLGNLAMLQDYPLFQVLRRAGVAEEWWFFGPFGSGRPFWTISIEWWIYLFFGVTLFWLVRSRGGRSAAGVALVAFLAVEPAYHFIGGYGQCLSMIWAIGMLLAIGNETIQARVRALWDDRREGRMLLLAAFAVLAALVAGRLLVNGLHVYELQFGLFVSLLLLLLHHLLGAARVELPEAVRAVPRFIADFSYSLYLTHFTLLTWLLTRVADGAIGRGEALWICLIGSNLIAIAFWWLFERHHRTLARAVERHFNLRPQSAPAAGRGAE